MDTLKKTELGTGRTFSGYCRRGEMLMPELSSGNEIRIRVYKELRTWCLTGGYVKADEEGITRKILSFLTALSG